MIIRKQFKFEGAHIVRDCSSVRCSRSIHGHSYIVEVFLTADGLDNGQMIVDFGLLKTNVNTFIDSFDHAYSLWNMESEEVKTSIKILSDRWIDLPFSPSAESYSLFFLYGIDRILKNTRFMNGEKNPRVHSVRVHETATGYAEAFADDLKMIKYNLSDVHFSHGVQDEWANKNWVDDILTHQRFENPKPSYVIRTELSTIKDIEDFVEPSAERIHQPASNYTVAEITPAFLIAMKEITDAKKD